MKYYYSFVTKFLAITLLILFSLVLWGNNKGFDLTDESLGVLLVQTNQSTGIYVTNYYLLVKRFLFFQPTITNLRLVFFICGIINSCFLSYFLHHWLKQKQTYYPLFKHSIYVYAFVILGSFFSYQHQRTISYDIINATMSISSLCFFLLSIIKISRPQKMLFLLLSGFFLSFLFTIRITAAIAELIILTSFLLLHLITISTNANLFVCFVILSKAKNLAYYIRFFALLRMTKK